MSFIKLVSVSIYLAKPAHILSDDDLVGFCKHLRETLQSQRIATPHLLLLVVVMFICWLVAFVLFVCILCAHLCAKMPKSATTISKLETAYLDSNHECVLRQTSIDEGNLGRVKIRDRELLHQHCKKRGWREEKGRTGFVL
jgi:hypothetical protein